MAEYIDRLDTYFVLTEYYHHRTATQHMALQEALEKVPIADVEPVVRCRDCIHYNLAHNGINGECRRQYATFYAYDFCSYGERGDAE